MKNIAFKRAKHSPSVKDSLHPDYITESADTSLFPEGFHKVEDGYEILSEDSFEEEFSKNESLQDEFLKKKREDELAKHKAQAATEIHKEAQDKKDMREYEEFKKWQQMKGKR